MDKEKTTIQPFKEIEGQKSKKSIKVSNYRFN